MLHARWRVAGQALGISIATLVVAAVAVLLATRGLFGCGTLDTSRYSLLLGTADCIIESVYKNVADPRDAELPVTVTGYSTAAHTVGYLGGGGEGLNCSVPRFALRMFDAPQDVDDHVLHRFRQACVHHDLCYRHGLATYGYAQNDCDTLLLESAYRLCLVTKGEGKFDKETDPAQRAADPTRLCQLEAKRFLFGVSFFGSQHYKGWNQSTFFEFELEPITIGAPTRRPRGRQSVPLAAEEQQARQRSAAISAAVPDQAVGRDVQMRELPAADVRTRRAQGG